MTDAGVRPFHVYVRIAVELFLASTILGIALYLVFPKMPKLIVAAVKHRVERLAAVLPFGRERITVAILIWNSVVVLLCVFGGVLALLIDRTILSIVPSRLRHRLERPPYADALIRLARWMGYEVSRYREADVILTLRMGPLVVPLINGVAAGSFFASVADKFGVHRVIELLLLPHGVIEFPTVVAAAALGLYLADHLIHRERVHRRWPDASLRPPSWVVRSVSYCLFALTAAAYLEVHVSPKLLAGSAGCVLR